MSTIPPKIRSMLAQKLLKTRHDRSSRNEVGAFTDYIGPVCKHGAYHTYSFVPISLNYFRWDLRKTDSIKRKCIEIGESPNIIQTAPFDIIYGC